MDQHEEIKLLQQNDRKAQKDFYDRLSPAMFGVCRRYLQNEQDAEDVMINGFFKAFTKIKQFSGQSKIDGWLRKIMVNECLMFLRKYNMNLSVELSEELAPSISDTDRNIHEEDILKLLDLLPVGYRTVFNLFAIEGFSHKEIAEKLQISINTSKSQLIKARKKLQLLLDQEGHRVA